MTDDYTTLRSTGRIRTSSRWISDFRLAGALLIAALLGARFRALGTPGARDQFTNRDAFDTWEQVWTARIANVPDPKTLMASANPAVIPRNHRIEAMIEAAVAGDMDPFDRRSKHAAVFRGRGVPVRRLPGYPVGIGKGRIAVFRNKATAPGTRGSSLSRR